MTAVPRKREAVHAAQVIERRGGHASDPKVARREALAEIHRRALADVLRSEDETARLLELAAANPELRARPLLEAYGQGAAGPIRPKSWWSRNGCHVRKGERAFLLSAFGNAFFGRDQVYGPDPGTIGARETPPNALPDIGEGHAIAILAARAGVRLRAEWSQPEPFTDETPELLRPAGVKALPSLAVLEAALAAVREYDRTATRCLSCDGYGCVLCSCQDDRVPVSKSDTVPKVSKPAKRSKSKPAKVKRPRGRPRAVRPDRIPDVAAAFEDAARLEAEAEQLRARSRSVRVQAIRDAQAAGYSLRDVAASLGVSLASVARLLAE